MKLKAVLLDLNLKDMKPGHQSAEMNLMKFNYSQEKGISVQVCDPEVL